MPFNFEKSSRENFVTHYLILGLSWYGVLMAIWAPDPWKWALSSIYCLAFGKFFGLMKKPREPKFLSKADQDLNILNLKYKK